MGFLIGSGTIFGRHSSGYNTMGTLRLMGGKLNVLLHTTTKAPTDFYDVTSTGLVPFNKWTYVATVYDGTNIYFYINGVLDSKSPVTGMIDAVYNGVILGSRINGGEFYTGNIDTARIYTSALTASDIQNIYAQEKDKYADSLAIK